MITDKEEFATVWKQDDDKYYSIRWIYHGGWKKSKEVTSDSKEALFRYKNKAIMVDSDSSDDIMYKTVSKGIELTYC